MFPKGTWLQIKVGDCQLWQEAVDISQKMLVLVEVRL